VHRKELQTLVALILELDTVLSFSAFQLAWLSSSQGMHKVFPRINQNKYFGSYFKNLQTNLIFQIDCTPYIL